ncbi:uncharacterized protein LOC128237759 [Mya arenaria]|uniref:uncharacterized protein LOC128237759 n=1 Tax=Mya arenaria TaxID=6604 RepID=UPI0022E28C29|nr:uncharacterized protein LOC128237759 [Mya arenaria]
MNMECFIEDLIGKDNFLEDVVQVTSLFKAPPSLAYADGNSNTIHILPNPGKLSLQRFQEKYAHLCVEDASRLKIFFVMTDQEHTTFFNNENENSMDGSKLLRNLFCTDRAQVRLKYSDLVKRTHKSVDPLSECPHQDLQQNENTSNVVPLSSLCLVPESREQASVVNQLSGDFSMSRKQEQFSGSLQNTSFRITVLLSVEINVVTRRVERLERSIDKISSDVDCSLVKPQNKEFDADTGPLVSKLTRDAVKDERKTSEKEEKTCGAIKRKDTRSSRLINDVHGQNAEQDQCIVHINETATQHTKAKGNNHPLSKAGRAKDTLMKLLPLSVMEKTRRNANISSSYEQQQLLREIMDFPEKSIHFTYIIVCPLYNTGFFSRAQLQQQAQEQQQEQQAEEQPGTAGGCRTPPRHQQQEAQQQAEEQPRYPIQCTEGSEIQDRESRNYDVVTSTRPVFSDRDFAIATNTPLTVTPTLNLPYAQERDLLDRVQGQSQYGTAGGGRTTPRHPQCQDQMPRQRSFTHWPATAHQAPARMVVYGLFYTGQQDLVRCYHCGIGLMDWSDGDEPLFEHIRHSPNCLFLRQLGEQLLNTYRILLLRKLLGGHLLNTYRENLAEAQRNNETGRSQGSEPHPAQQLTRRVAHTGMTTLAQRLGTFNEWPQSTGQQPEALANAGLFFTGINDMVQVAARQAQLEEEMVKSCLKTYVEAGNEAGRVTSYKVWKKESIRGLPDPDFQNTDTLIEDITNVYDDRNTDGHFDDRNTDGHYDDRNTDRHYDDRNTDGHFNDRNTDRHYDDRNTDGHYDDRNTDGHYDDRNNDGLYAERNTDGHYDDRNYNDRFPNCSIVREMLQAAAQQEQLEEEESVVVPGQANLDMQNTDPIERDAAKAVLEMGYSRAAVRLAIHEFNGRNPSQRTLRFTADELVKILAGRQERGEPIPDDDTDPEEQGAFGGAAMNLPESDPIEENKRLKGILNCFQCKENNCNILLLPCTHHCLCEPCAENITNCPVCGRKVEERVRTRDSGAEDLTQSASANLRRSKRTLTARRLEESFGNSDDSDHDLDSTAGYGNPVAPKRPRKDDGRSMRAQLQAKDDAIQLLEIKYDATIRELENF